MTKKSVIFDADCVLLDFYKGLENIYHKIFGNEIQPLEITYNLQKRYNLKEEEFGEIWKALDSGAMRNLPGLHGASEVFNAYKNTGYEVYIVSGIKEKVKEDRLYNLAQLEMHPDELYCVGSGTSSKEELIAKINPTIIWDDRLQHLSGLSVPNRILIDNGDDQVGFEENRFSIATEIHSSLIDFVHNSPIVEPEIKDIIQSKFPKARKFGR